MELAKLEVYSISMELSGRIWSIVKCWTYFEKETIGKQMIRSSDSVSANISEGFGRFYFKDSKVFLYHARGSLYETRTWLKKHMSEISLRKTNIKNLRNGIQNWQ